ncbi:MAG: hypothetical protein HYT39_03215 [Candidatus Sungbacteria bacterium]|nr:hypothetical protein [Candidatus Sungbacteria bacterium]
MSFNALQEIRKRRARHSFFRASREARKDRAKGYRVISISLYNQQAEAVDWAMNVLRRAGYLNASRSFVIQTLIEQCLEGKSPREIERFFEGRRMNLLKPRSRKK